MAFVRKKWGRLLRMHLHSLTDPAALYAGLVQQIGRKIARTVSIAMSAYSAMFQRHPNPSMIVLKLLE